MKGLCKAPLGPVNAAGELGSQPKLPSFPYAEHQPDIGNTAAALPASEKGGRSTGASSDFLAELEPLIARHGLVLLRIRHVACFNVYTAKKKSLHKHFSLVMRLKLFHTLK